MLSVSMLCDLNSMAKTCWDMFFSSLQDKEHKKEMKKRNPFKVKQVKARG